MNNQHDEELEPFEEMLLEREKFIGTPEYEKYKEQEKKYFGAFAINEITEPEFMQKEFHIPDGSKFDCQLLKRQLDSANKPFISQRINAKPIDDAKRISMKELSEIIIKSEFSSNPKEELEKQLRKGGYLEK